MSLPAFFVKNSLAPGDSISLDGEDAAHAQALRLRPGDLVELYNGEGHVTVCAVEAISRQNVGLCARSTAFVPPPAVRTIIALALSKAARRGFFMEKAAELGASEIWLWQAERSVPIPGGGAMGACHRQLVAGALQSHNPWFPSIIQANNASGVVARANAVGVQHRILPWEEQKRTEMLLPEQLGQAGATIFVIGPEGGLTREEADLFINAGFAAVSLGKRILRCETAASLCLGLQSWAAQLPGHPDAA